MFFHEGFTPWKNFDCSGTDMQMHEYDNGTVERDQQTDSSAAHTNKSRTAIPSS